MCLVLFVNTPDSGGGGGITLQTNGTNNGSQLILNLKQGTNITLTDDGVGGITITSSGGGSSAWGSITGTLSSQTDLQTALDSKVNSISGILTTPELTSVNFNAANPATPGATRVELFARERAGRPRLQMMDDDGTVNQVQGYLGSIVKRQVKVATGATLLTTVGLPAAPTASGTATAVSFASTNLCTRAPRLGYLSAATAASLAGVRTTNGSTQAYIRAGRGFDVTIQFSIIATVSDRQLYAGLAPGTTTFNTGNPSNALNSIMLGMDSTDTNLQIMHNDGTGSCTKIDLGASFPAPTINQDFYELRLYQAPGSLNVGYYVENLHNGNKADGLLSTDLPALDQGLTVQLALSNGATASAVQIALTSIDVEQQLN